MARLSDVSYCVVALLGQGYCVFLGPHPLCIRGFSGLQHVCRRMKLCLGLIALSLASVAAHGAGVWTDPNHALGDGSLAGLRFVAESPPHVLTLVSTDNGVDWCMLPTFTPAPPTCTAHLHLITCPRAHTPACLHLTTCHSTPHHAMLALVPVAILPSPCRAAGTLCTVAAAVWACAYVKVKA